MTLEAIYVAMIQYLQDEGASTHQIAGYEALWRLAERHSKESISCPACYLAGDALRLIRLPTLEGIGSVRCVVCFALLDQRELPGTS